MTDVWFLPDHWEVAKWHTPDSLTDSIYYIKVNLLFDSYTYFRITSTDRGKIQNLLLDFLLESPSNPSFCSKPGAKQMILDHLPFPLHYKGFQDVCI